MPNFLYRLPNFLIMAVFVGVFIFILAALPRLLQLIPFFAPTIATEEYAQLIFITLSGSTGLIVGFLLQNGQDNLRYVENLVADEAGRINNLDRLLLRFGDDQALEVRTILVQYVESTINKEWADLWNGQGNNQTHMLWRAISQKIFELNPKTPKQLSLYSEIIEKAEEVSESRESRIDKATDRLSNIFWVVIGLLIVSLALINTLRFQSNELIFANTIVPAALGGLVSLLVILDQPFKGESCIQPKALRKVLASILTRAK